MVNSLSDLQTKVLIAVYAEIDRAEWFDGVCWADIPNDEEIRADFRKAVDEVIFNTRMGDDPDLNKERDR